MGYGRKKKGGIIPKRERSGHLFAKKGGIGERVWGPKESWCE